MFLDLSPKMGSPKPNNGERVPYNFWDEKREKQGTQQAKFCFWLSIWLERKERKKIANQGKSNRLQIDRDEDIFVKTMFVFNESHAKLPYQLKTHVRGATLATLAPRLPICDFH